MSIASTADELAPRTARRPILVVSNREPYLHAYAEDGSISWAPTTGGVAVALDALMRERGGVWIAHGAGSADRAVVDADDRVMVPPDNPTYPLRRIWLSAEEETHYYAGFANEGLWPLCHEAHVRPVFRAVDWASYQTVNDRFADVIDEELPDDSAPVFIQDYQLALVGSALRARRTGVRTALFWHIPWPHPDRLRICPWRRGNPGGLARQQPARVSARSGSPQLHGRSAGRTRRDRGRPLGDSVSRSDDQRALGADRRRLRPDPGAHDRADDGQGDRQAPARASYRYAPHRNRCGPARLYERHS